ncbi:MAG: PAS domain-containing sensor histidine kinase [Actinomycetota bacterium]
MTRARDQLRRVRSLLDGVEAVVWECDAAGTFTFVSAGAERLLGYPPEAWSAEGFLAGHVHPDDRRTALGTIASATRQRRPFDLEFRMLHRDRRTVWVRALARPASDAGATRGLLIDVTRHRLEEDRGSEMELRYQRLIEHLPAIVYTESATEDEAVVVYVSPQIRLLLGVDPADWIGSSAGWLSRVHEDDRARVEAANAESDRTGRPFAEEYRMRTGSGTLVWFHDESVLVRDDDGRPLFWQGVMLDVTEQRRAIQLEEELLTERAETDALRELDELKNTFLQAVSHDLRTPLAAILGLAVTLEREDVELTEVEARDLASRIASNARKLDRIVNDLLDLDRIGRGIVQPNVVETDVGHLVRRIVADSDLARQRQVAVDAVPAFAEIDPPKVERIVENLLANTGRHTPASARVWVRVCEERDGVTIAVEDDGPGIRPELRESIFEPFNRGEATAERGAGVGIGLALVARFAELHGGRAWVQERDGGGASFRVWLPARSRELDNVEIPEPEPAPAGR